MKKIIVTTTINPPTEAIRRFDAMEDWELLVIGDVKTPEYKLKRGTFLGVRDWEMDYLPLVDIIGFDSVRLGRMVSFIEAYRRGADIVACIDDDCIPEENWGKHVFVGQEKQVTYYAADDGLDRAFCFDPFPTSSNEVASRGIPIEQIRDTGFQFEEFPKTIKPLVQCDGCYGQGDVYAFYRLAGKYPNMKDIDALEWPCASDRFSPINTQNTFFHRTALRDFYGNIPFIGRADDIWAGYIFQQLHPDSTIFGAPSATHYQERSIKSILSDLEDEIFMYKHTQDFLNELVKMNPKTDQQIDWILRDFSCSKAVEAVQCYRSYFK